MTDLAIDSPAATTLRNHVAGSWQEVDALGTLTDRDPATGEVLAHVPLSSAAAVGPPPRPRRPPNASGARCRRRSVPAT